MKSLRGKFKGPDFIVPGFPKCGTTWLFHKLNEIDGFSMPHNKELHFFNRDKSYNFGKSGGTHSYLKCRKRLLRNFNLNGYNFFREFLKIYEPNDLTYLKLFSSLNGISGDITPIYILLEERGIERMAQLLKDVRILFILRDPIDRAWSQFRMKYSKVKRDGVLKEEDIISFLQKCLNRRRGFYKEMITIYKQLFPKSKIGIAFYDTLREKPAEFLKEIVEFLSDGKLHCNIDNVSLHQKHNVSQKIEIPEKVYTMLKRDLKYQYKWVIHLTPEIGNMWYSMHYRTNFKGSVQYPTLLNYND